MDLIDMQSLSYNDYRYIMVYQDHMTQFVVLRKEDEIRPTFASTPNIDLYGVRLIPEW
jgi:hypothetical protein